MPTPTTTTFTPTGAAQTFVVPYYTPGTFRLACAGGAGNRSAGVPNGSGGNGGSVRGWWDPPPGTLLTIWPGYAGVAGITPTAYRGGIGGYAPTGGPGAGRGGCASFIEVASAIIMIAGGGGGAGREGSGGGGGGSGGLGVAAGSNGGGGTTEGGRGGTLLAPGAAGSATVLPGSVYPTAGVAGVGGNGGDWLSSQVTAGGAGGGGYFGGGGGGFGGSGGGSANAGGGGGGSSWCDASLFSSIDNTGGQEGDGIVTITYDWIADWSPPTDGWSVGFLKF